MTKEVLTADLCVIGAGSGGLSVAAGASQMGANVILLEGGKMGGDCLNYGCVPSKSLLAAAHAAQEARSAHKFGITADKINIDMQAVHDHIHNIIADIEPHDSVQRFEGLGVRVIQKYGHFSSENAVTAGDYTIKAKKFIISTGSSAFIPPIEGLDKTPYLTNETIFNLTDLPEHLIILGGGPIGCEMAQAYANLGSKVSILSLGTILNKDDKDAVQIIRDRFLREGIDLYENAITTKFSKRGQVTTATFTLNGKEHKIKGSHLLIAAGRKANIEPLNLERANVETDARAIKVDARMRTSNKNIFAIGDASNTFQFTHIAGYQAGIVIQNALFKLPAKANYKALPWVTYTAPELAQVGLNETMATEKYGESIKVLKFDYADNDRARAERKADGFIKVITKKNGVILGATIVGHQAGEHLMPWSLAMSKGLKVKDIAGLIVPYPTISEINKRAAGSFFTKAIFSPRTKKLVRLLQKLPF